jgi:hypothetical protein
MKNMIRDQKQTAGPKIRLPLITRDGTGNTQHAIISVVPVSSCSPSDDFVTNDPANPASYFCQPCFASSVLFAFLPGNQKSKIENQKSYDFRHLMSPNFALILRPLGCDDPPMILPSSVSIGVHPWLNSFGPVRCSVLFALLAVKFRVFCPFSKQFKPFQTLTFNSQIP